MRLSRLCSALWLLPGMLLGLVILAVLPAPEPHRSAAVRRLPIPVAEHGLHPLRLL